MGSGEQGQPGELEPERPPMESMRCRVGAAGLFVGMPRILGEGPGGIQARFATGRARFATMPVAAVVTSFFDGRSLIGIEAIEDRTSEEPAMRHRLCFPLALLVLAGCGSSTGPDGDPPPILTELPRTLSPSELRIVEGANAFAFDLLREATAALPPDSNAFLSPLSASMALGMALNGAGGETYDAMRSTLRLGSMAETDINLGYRDLIALFDGLDSRTEMRIANSIWGHSTLPIEPSFTDAGRTYFDAAVSTLDFGTPEALAAINEWVSGKTNGRIPRLLDRLSPDEVLFLINAIYFKGKWRHAFDVKDTRGGPFHGADGLDRAAHLMWQRQDLRYDETEDYQAVDLLYGSGAFAMTVLLPKVGRTPTEVLSGLDPETWSGLTGRFDEREVALTLPRFRLEYGRRLNDDLKALGMGIAFGAGADFDRIADLRPRRLYITRVEQKTFVEVNEEGTEAAAATAVGFGPTSAPVSVEMRVDRPFVVAIRERLSGAVLFLGVINVVGD
jgi:serine protease inhibitor